jgi:hypothetical protein
MPTQKVCGPTTASTTARLTPVTAVGVAGKNVVAVADSAILADVLAVGQVSGGTMPVSAAVTSLPIADLALALAIIIEMIVVVVETTVVIEVS